MVKELPIKVLYIRDDKDIGRYVEERLVRHGIAVNAVGDRQAHAAIRDRDAYDVLCADITAINRDSFHDLHKLIGGNNVPPMIMITSPETAADAGKYNDLGPICFIVRDADGRYLDMLPRLIERLSYPQTRIRQKREIEKILRETEERLLMSQKNEVIGMLAGGIAHDFNNILATILGYASFLKGKATQEDVFFNGLAAIEDSAVRASDLTSQIMSQLRGGKAEIKTLSINQVIGDVYKLIKKTFDKSIRIVLDLDEHISMIKADTAQMKQIVLSLSINARDIMPGGGVLTIKTFMSRVPDDRTGTGKDIPPGAYVAVGISDTGSGMDERTGRQIRGPHFSKNKGRGTAGPGLSVVNDIVKAHGGWIDVKSEVGAGTQFVILLPASENNQDAPITESGAVEGGSETILVVDDETQIVKMLRRILADSGYRVLYSDSGAEGVRIFEEKGKEINLVLLDIMMPGMGGKEVMSRLLSLRPDAKILLVSGFSQQDRHRDLMGMGAAGFIGKPFVIRDLLKKIRNILG
ncbi:MAG: response regulator [Deltaproteobacteria bacterium]|nr:response regulator [Candidatus Zymogenaceae bacterium]